MEDESIFVTKQKVNVGHILYFGSFNDIAFEHNLFASKKLYRDNHLGGSFSLVLSTFDAFPDILLQKMSSPGIRSKISNWKKAKLSKLNIITILLPFPPHHPLTDIDNDKNKNGK